MTATTSASTPLPSPVTPALILIGLDDKQKRHASYFIDTESEKATAAAHLMGMASLLVTDDELTQLALKLPRGKIFESGKAFVPFVKEPLFNQLADRLPDRSILQSLRAAASAANADKPDDASPTYTLPKDWSAFKIGDVVLATEGEQEGWWEAVVKGVSGDLLALGWRDWPQENPFSRKRTEVALMWSPPTKPTAN